MSKRILSLALVVMMLVAFIPATLFTASAEGEVGYKFRIAFGLDGAHKVEELGLAPSKNYNSFTIEYSANPKTITHYAMTDGLWKYYASKGLSDSYGGMLGSGIQLSSSGYVAYKVNIPATSTYDITTTSLRAYGSTDYILLPATTAASAIESTITAGENVIYLLQGVAPTGGGQQTTANGIYIEKGEYVLVLKGSTMCPKWLDFQTSGATDFAPLHVGFVEDSKVKKGESAEIKSWIFNVDSKTRITEGITYSLEDPSFGEVSGSTLTAKKLGNTTISAAVEGSTGSVLAGKLEVNETAYRVSFKLGVFQDVPELNLYHQKASGESDTNAAWRDFTTIKDYAMTFGAWKFYAHNGANPAYQGVHTSAKKFANYFTGGVGSWVALKLNVPVSGVFDISLTSAGKSVQSDYFLLPGNTPSGSIKSAMDSENAIVIAEDFGPSGVSTVTAKAVELTKGEYIFAFRTDVGGWVTTNLNTLELKTSYPDGDYQPVYFGTIDPLADTMEVGDTASANARVFNAYDYSAYEGDITFDGGDKFSVDGNQLTAVKFGYATITATLPGVASGFIPRTGTVYNKETPYQFKYEFGKIYEREDLGLKFVNSTSDTTRIQVTSIKDYAMTHGAWKVVALSGHQPKYSGINNGSFFEAYLSGNTGFATIKLNVPVSGTFDANLILRDSGSDETDVDIYLFPGSTDVSTYAKITAAAQNGEALISTNYARVGNGATDRTFNELDLAAGEYSLVIKSNTTAWNLFGLKSLTFSTTAPKGDYQPVYFGTIDPMEIDKGKTAEAKARVYSATAIDTEYTGDVTFATDNATIATVSGSTVTGVGSGTTSLSASVPGAASSIIPVTVEVVTKETPYKFTYDFRNVYNVPEANLFWKEMISQGGYADVKSITDYALTHGAWKFYAASSGVISTWGGINPGQAYQPYFTAAGDYLALKLNVPATGTFDIALQFPSQGTAKASYYLLPGDTAVADLATVAASDKAIVLGTDIESSGSRNVKVSGASIQKGEYIFYYTGDGSGWKLMRPTTLTFTTSGVTEGFSPIFFGTIDSKLLKVGEKATTALRVYNAQNVNEPYTPSSVTFQVTDPTVASIDGAEITALQNGKTTVTASAGITMGLIPGNIEVADYGYRFKYIFKTNSPGMVELPELDIYPWKNGMEYTYDWRTVNDYAITHGMWKFHTASGASSYGGITAGYTQLTPTVSPNTDKNNFYAIKIKVPVSGTYDVTYTTYHSNATYIYLIPGDTPATVAAVGNLIAGEDKRVLFDGISLEKGTTTFTHEDFEIEAGEYVLVFKTGYYGNMRPAELTFVSSDATVFKPVYVGTVDPIKVGEDETATANARIYDAWTYDAYKGTPSFAVEDAGVASVAGKTVTPAGTGTTTISATLLYGMVGTVEDGTISVATQELVDAFAKKSVASYSKGTTTAKAYVKGVGDTGFLDLMATKKNDKNQDVPIYYKKNSNGTYTFTAPEVEGYKFLYWVKGLQEAKKILSFDAAYTYDPVAGSNIIIAVYEQTGATEETKAEFYNPNGQLVTTLTANGPVPALPTAPGKTPLYWKNKYGKKLDVGGNVTLEEGKSEIWVAVYDSTVASVIVTAENATGGGTVDYGSLVTLTANGSGTFKWWEKTDAEGKTEIVGFGSTSYSFYAWDDCTVTAVYGSEAPVYYSNKAMKILVDTFNGNNVMAEFIGFAGTKILEKGIMLGKTDYAMSTNNMQFTLYNNSGAAAKGYAIVEINGKAFRIEDGE